MCNYNYKGSFKAAKAYLQPRQQATLLPCVLNVTMYESLLFASVLVQRMGVL